MTETTQRLLTACAKYLAGDPDLDKIIATVDTIYKAGFSAGQVEGMQKAIEIREAVDNA